jgi:uncharacterized delta-60 repeat protein
MEILVRTLSSIAFLILTGCFANLGSVANSQLAKDLKITSHSINTTSDRSVSFSIDIEGDSNNNAKTTLYFCSVLKESGCDPLSGDSLSLTKSSTNFSANINFDSYGYLSHDLVKYVSKTTDSDGVEGAEAKGFFTLGNDVSKIKKMNQIGFLKEDLSSKSSTYIQGVEKDTEGNFYLYGYANAPISEASAGGWDSVIIKMNSKAELDKEFGYNGILQLGNLSFGEGTNRDDYLLDLHVLSDGKLVLAGYTKSDLGEENAGQTDAFVMRLNADGTLDKTFNANGVFQLGNTTVGAAASSFDYVRDSCIDSSGLIYLVGSTRGSLGDTLNGPEDILVVRLTANGYLDTNFDSDGIVQLGTTTLAAASGTEMAEHCAIDNNNKLLLTGYAYSDLGESSGAGKDGIIIRFNSSGGLDTSFSGNGIFQFGSVSTPNANTSDEHFYGITVSSAGKIAVAGYTKSNFEETLGGTQDAIIAVFNDDGSLDTSFSSNGVLQFGSSSFGANVSSSEALKAIHFDSSGNLFIYGTTSSDFGETNAGSSDLIVVKVLPDGSLDTSFSSDGIFQFGASTSNAQATQSEYVGKMLVKEDGGVSLSAFTNSSIGISGYAGGWEPLIVDVKANGELNTTFNSTGYKQINITGSGKRVGSEVGMDLAIDSSGNVYLACHTTSNLGESNGGGYDVCVVKYLPNGNLDTSFANGGIFQLGESTIPSGLDVSNNEYVKSIALDGAGGVYVLGYTLSGLAEANGGLYDVFIVKLNSSGALDTSFSGDGLWQFGATTNLGTAPSGYETPAGIAIDSNGKIVIAGSTGSNLKETKQGIYDVFVMRLNADGSFDTSFNVDGVFHAGATTLASGISTDFVNSMVLDSSDNIILGGYTQSDLGETNGGGNDIFVMKITSAGALDTNFNTDGIFHLGSTTGGATQTSAFDHLTDLAIVPSTGAIVGVGDTTGNLGETSGGEADAVMIVLNSTGNLETGFNSTGIKQFGSTTIGANSDRNDYFKSVSVSGTDIYVLGETMGSLIGANTSMRKDVFIAKVSSGGVFDTSFSSDGRMQLDKTTIGVSTIADEEIKSSTIASDGNLYFVGHTNGSIGAVNGGNYDMIFGIIGADGSLD